MTFAEFRTLAEEDWERIPDTFKEGVDGLVVVREARAHERSADVWTLGECVTESWPSEFGGPETIRSELILYYGSFRRLAGLDDAFDWAQETWDTITHELKHHLESLASEDDLEDVDASMEQHFRRHDGEPFDPLYFRGGEPLGEGWYRLEDAFFLEAAAGDDALVFEWANSEYRIDVSTRDAEDIAFLVVDGVDDPPDELVVVMVRERSLGARLGALFRPRKQVVVERNVTASRVA